MEKVVPKMHTREAQMQDNPGGRVSAGTQETVAAKLVQFTVDETGKDQFLRGNQRNLAEEKVVRKSSSPKRVT